MDHLPAKIKFTEDQVLLIKKQIAPQANDNELKLFLYQCQRTGLDPLTRQIYCIHRAGRMTIQTSIDGFRVIAERSGDYGGQDEPVYTYDENKKIVSCKVTVYKFRGDIRYPAATAIAYFNEYYPNPINLQKSMPHVMIAKVAEALALRKAYPQDLSGLYTTDEMQQAEPKENPLSDDIDDVPDEKERTILRSMASSSTLSDEQKMAAYEAIDKLQDYTAYQKLHDKLSMYAQGYNDVANPSTTDAKKHVKKITG